jgi:hypothetical protein
VWQVGLTRVVQVCRQWSALWNNLWLYRDNGRDKAEREGQPEAGPPGPDALR